MGIKFNADEVFEIAINIEKNGAAFYRKAAQSQNEADNKDFLNKLAGMEDLHLKTFEEMRKNISNSEKQGASYDPYDELSLYLSAAADFHGGEGSPKAADKLNGTESISEIINIAMDLEKKSILYYIGLKDLVPEKLGKDKIDNIIDEEKKHVIQLAQALSRITN